jgi:hypothetical protein
MIMQKKINYILYMGTYFLLAASISTGLETKMQNNLKGPYFGQKPPGMTPELFAPGFISTEKYGEQRCIFSPDGRECYFVRRGEYPKTKIVVTRLLSEGWSKPEPVSFSSQFSESMHVLTHDGSRMFYNSHRPLPGTTKENRSGIWFVDRTREGWGKPQYFGYGSQVTITKDGTLYYRDPDNHPRDSLIIRRTQNGKYSEPEVLSMGVNGHRPGHPWIAPDESFILFDTWHPDGQGKGKYPDFYVCFRKEDGSWGEPINLGDSINKELHNNICSISPDGKYFFYTYEGDIYWVSIKVIEKLKKSE